MRVLSIDEIPMVAGSSVEFLDLAYLWAGYHSLGMGITTFVGASIGASMGVFNLLFPIEGSIPIAGLFPTASLILLPCLLGGTIAFLEYNLANYCASWITQE